jgi:predicted DsbA family dithiol-disulfide isomerase
MITSMNKSSIIDPQMVRVEIWSDIVCPWCYVGKRRFERGLATLHAAGEFEIVYRAFQLNPSMPKGEVRDHRDNLMAKYGLSESRAAAMQEQMERTAAAEGLEFHLVGGVTGNTFDAHVLVHLGRVRGIQDAVVERLFRAHFTEQRSIFDEDSLAALAADAGLDAGEARATLAGKQYADAVNADLRDARGLGISAVPYYVIDRRYAISGAQPPELFAEVLARARADARTAVNRR